MTQVPRLDLVKRGQGLVGQKFDHPAPFIWQVTGAVSETDACGAEESQGRGGVPNGLCPWGGEGMGPPRL
jgi:hypothetical protein